MQSTQTPTPKASLSILEDLVVISVDLEGYRCLAQNVAIQAEVLPLSPAQDGVAAIAQMLVTLPQIRRLHLVTPNCLAGLRLGRVTLRYDNLPAHAQTLSQWRSLLAPAAEVVIYNGEMACTETGKLLIDVLHHLTGAAIAACTAFPNAVFPSGRWEFDYATLAPTPSLTLPLELVKQCLITNQNCFENSPFAKISC
ncbi:MAG: DUF4347 domain-containing protein [Nodosilinea sp.]